MKRALLNKVFPHFENELKDELENKGILRIYKKGSTIVRMNDVFESSYIILQGCLKVYRENTEGAEFLVAFLKEGQNFAVSASASSSTDSKRSLLTFVTIEETCILNISFDDKDSIAQRYATFYKYILATATMYYGFFLNLIDNITFKKLDLRIELFIQSLSHIINKRVLSITHQEIAVSLHCSREAVSRALKAMEKAGKISLGHNEIELNNL
jgi:CRP/FNR family transcriptional regulator, anaerobic regulatory protein